MTNNKEKPDISSGFLTRMKNPTIPGRKKGIATKVTIPFLPKRGSSSCYTTIAILLNNAISLQG